jgi:hypothetical protein
MLISSSSNGIGAARRRLGGAGLVKQEPEADYSAISKQSGQEKQGFQSRSGKLRFCHTS